jgi:hypothetical protein
MLNLPKNLNEHPRLAAIQSRLSDASSPMWPGGKLTVPRWEFETPLRSALSIVVRNGHLAQGLESIVKDMDREQKGLQAALSKHAVPPSPRLSRLLLLAQDGSERFYRDAESLLSKHDDRMLGAILKVDSAGLGQHIGAKGPAKALLINDKTTLGLFLAALAPG